MLYFWAKRALLNPLSQYTDTTYQNIESKIIIQSSLCYNYMQYLDNNGFLQLKLNNKKLCMYVTKTKCFIFNFKYYLTTTAVEEKSSLCCVCSGCATEAGVCRPSCAPHKTRREDQRSCQTYFTIRQSIYCIRD